VQVLYALYQITQWLDGTQIVETKMLESEHGFTLLNMREVDIQKWTCNLVDSLASHEPTGVSDKVIILEWCPEHPILPIPQLGVNTKARVGLLFRLASA